MPRVVRIGGAGRAEERRGVVRHGRACRQCAWRRGSRARRQILPLRRAQGLRQGRQQGACGRAHLFVRRLGDVEGRGDCAQGRRQAGARHRGRLRSGAPQDPLLRQDGEVRHVLPPGAEGAGIFRRTRRHRRRGQGDGTLPVPSLAPSQRRTVADERAGARAR